MSSRRDLDEWFDSLSADAQLLVLVSPMMIIGIVLIVVAIINRD